MTGDSCTHTNNSCLSSFPLWLSIWVTTRVGVVNELRQTFVLRTKLMWSQRKGLLNHPMLDCLIERTGFIRKDKHTSTLGFCFGWSAGERPRMRLMLECVGMGIAVYLSVQEGLKNLFVWRIRGIMCVCVQVFVHSPGRRSRTAGRWLVQPSNRWRDRWTPFPSAGARRHWKDSHTEFIIRWYFMTLSNRIWYISLTIVEVAKQKCSVGVEVYENLIVSLNNNIDNISQSAIQSQSISLTTDTSK